MLGSGFNTFAVMEDYKTHMTNGSQHSGIFLSQLSRDDGADCISDISSLYNPMEDRQTELWQAGEDWDSKINQRNGPIGR